jgi:Flp pilus assembly protein TadG
MRDGLSNQEAEAVRRPYLEDGQSLVELAVMFSVLVMLLLGVVDFTWVFQSYVRANTAANAGVVYASQGTTEANNATGVQSAALAGFSSWTCTSSGPTVSAVLGTDTNGNTLVTVTVQCQVSGLTILKRMLGTITVTGKAVRRVDTS